MIKRPLFERIKPFLYLLPFIVSVTLFTLSPIVNVIRMSFLEGYKYLTGAYTGVGLGNYEKVINNPYFRQAISNTFKYVLLVVPISTVIAVILANVLNQKIKFQGFFQTCYFLPMVTSSLAVGLSWRFMFNDKYGVINYLLTLIGIDPVTFLGNPSGNFLALVIFGIWAILPNTIILLLSGLQNIDPLYYTAAKVDGAKTLRIFCRITFLAFWVAIRPNSFDWIGMRTISSISYFSSIFFASSREICITGSVTSSDTVFSA